MRRLVFDIETNGLLPDVSVLHCIATVDVDTGEGRLFPPNELQEGLQTLAEADVLIGHNIVAFDIPALKKTQGWTPHKDQKIIDTLTSVQMLFSDQERDDSKHPDSRIKKLNGGHRLEDWGLRLNCPKLDFKGPWGTYTEQMGRYCLGDVRTNLIIYKHCVKHGWDGWDGEPLRLEQYISHLYSNMELTGFPFDVPRAEKLKEELMAELERIAKGVDGYTDYSEEETSTPEYWLTVWPNGEENKWKTKGEAEIARKSLGHKPKECRLERGPNIKKRVNPYAGSSAKNKPFNPGSGKQVRKYLWEKLQWISPQLTKTGTKLLEAGGDYATLAKEYGQTSENLLRTLTVPEAILFADAAMVKKVASMVATGPGAWLKQVKEDKRIHARFIGCACVTHRGASCIEESQLVKTPEGDIPIKDIVPGQYVYSWTPTHGWRMNKVLEVIDRGFADVFDYYFNSRSGDCKLRCTPNHRIMTQQNGYLCAGELERGEKIAFLHTEMQETDWGPRKWLFGTGYFGKQQSTFIKEQLYPELAGQLHMHHKDENKLNDSISNLEALTPEEHSRIHKEGKMHLLENLPSKWAVLRLIAEAKGSIRDVPHDFDTFKKYCEYYGICSKVCNARYTKKGSVCSERRYVTKGELKRAAEGAKSQNEIARRLGVFQRTSNKWFIAHGLDFLLPNARVHRVISREDFLAAYEECDGNTKKMAHMLGTTVMGIRNRKKHYRIPENHWYSHCKHVGTAHVYDLHVERDNNFVCEELVVHNSSPNLQQVSSVKTAKDAEGNKHLVWGFDGRYGADCRALFCAIEGYLLVGCDLSGIEARKLAHFLYKYDGGAYVQQVLEGDIHQLNASAVIQHAGYQVTRDEIKTPFYAFLYSVGAEKQGRQVCSISKEAFKDFQKREAYYTRKPEKIKRSRWVGGKKVPFRPTDQAYADVGNKVNKALTQGIEGMEDLLNDVQKASERGYLKVLDRHIPVRKKHSALNTLLQGSAGICFKRWLLLLDKDCKRFKIDKHFHAPVHDELQASVRPYHEEQYAELALDTIRRAGEYYQLNIPLYGEVKKGGRNWAETH